MRNNYLPIGRDDNVHLQNIDAKGCSVQKSRKGIFGEQAPAAAVAMHLRARGRKQRR